MPKGNYNSFHCSNIFCKFLLKLIFRIRFVFLNIFRFNFFIFDFLLSFLSLYFHIYFFLLKSGPSWPLFIYFCLFDAVDNKQVNKQMSDINFADDWSQTADHWYWKRPLYQVGHNHFPHLIIFYSIFLFCKLWPTTASLFYLKISLPSQFNDKPWKRANMVCSEFEPGAAGRRAHTNPLCWLFTLSCYTSFNILHM